ncbi:MULTISPECIES: pyrroline-5-carboxylate reductase [Halocynthiibacter]|uniref:Pyrroline-5-carboxylate reductase n=1 Tax=Halocynthiibacter halioticoli TaxID=2986804 RepID=A0AAE3IXB5_9RHOB|nr:MULTISPECIES: pyrroline-5-carboxylate reductase [Halocynthiibacter]MCV6823719.1 pyrroline-5-carboxylate reductase [Halocynthiibacter halioticoli]MCW4056720.1 pyrroline-5-carboxylate reductase [Halocynthiibacter sp. SDUM655004]
MQEIKSRGIVLLGCGKMGSAMLAGWLENGLTADSVWILDPNPSDWVQSLGAHVNEGVPENPAVVLIAVKPQMMQDALPTLKPLGNGETLFVSVAAGCTIASYEAVLGAQTPIIRAMPNTPAAVGRGITALVANAHASSAQLDAADSLLAAVGQTVRLDDESQMDAVTAVSGSGPAYVFHLIETLAKAGELEGLPPELAMKLAKATVGGAGQLAEDASETPSELRVNVTSPAGTTAAALEVLMDEESGFPDLLARAVKAAADRSRELAQ